AWIVNPSAATEAEFKIGELDLSAYADADGKPEMNAGVIVNDRLYITLQRLDNYAVTQTAYVAIFDVNTDQEIDALIAGDALKGIPLQARNPGTIVYEPTSNSIFVQGVGSYAVDEFTGGIERIDLATLTSTMIVDDGDAGTNLYGKTSALAVVSDSILYFVGYADFFVNTLYKLDLTTSEITATSVTSLINSQISSLAVDAEGLLWVSDTATATVHIIDPVTDTEVDALYTNLNPNKIVFVK
ncbi:MAG: hypothetical protein KAT90_06035, partial [Gammaproteobacteria bacterium]|nr:hypothetical protein [Gammaproteobacteria bacterium]